MWLTVRSPVAGPACAPRVAWRLVTALGFVAGVQVFATTVLDVAQVEREYTRKSWYVDNGLPDERVTALLQSHDGYLWIGTQSGIARFDGRGFTIYNRANTPQLTSDYCHTIVEDPLGNLWFGFRSGRCLARRSAGGFTVFSPPDPRESFDGCRLLASRSGGVWCGVDRMLYRIEGDQVKAHPLASDLYPDPIPLREEEDGTVILGGWELSALFNPRSNSFERLPLLAGNQQRSAVAICSGSGQEAWLLSVDSKTNSSAVTATGHMTVLKDGRWSPRLVPDDGGFLLDTRARFLTRDSRGALWLPGDGRGIVRYLQGQYEILPMPQLSNREFPMCATTDREGDLWIGSDYSGLQRWTPRKVTTYGHKEGLANDNVWTVLEARDGSVWVGTEAGVSHLENGRSTNFNFGTEPPANVIRSLAQTRDGTIWVGTIRLLESIRNGVLSEHRLPGPWEETKIRCLLASSDGALWVGTARGLTRITNQHPFKFIGADSPANHDVRTLLQDQNGDVWVGTAGAGLFRFHDGSFAHWTRTNGLCSENIWTLYQGADGGLWIGSDSGLNLWKDGALTAFTTAEGLPVNEADSILEDDIGRVWVSHDHGLYWVEKSQFAGLRNGGKTNLVAITYDAVDGLPTLEFNGQKGNPAACKTRDGRLWFASTKGVVVIDPAKALSDEVPPLTAIEQVRANGRVLFDRTKPASSSGNSAPPDRVVPRRPELVAASMASSRSGRTEALDSAQLPPGGGKVIEFRYNSLVFHGPEKVRFRFRLLGLSDQWIDAEDRREAYFTDLRPGNYRFEVIAANHHGVWQQKGATFAFTVAPHFYQTSWFYVVCGLTLVLGGAKLFTWRAGELRKLHLLEQHKALAQQRERFARDVHDELGASLTQIVGLADLAKEGAGLADPLGKRVHQIGSVAKGMVTSIGEIVWATNPKYDTLFDLVGYLRECCAEYFAHTSTDVRLEFPDQVPALRVTGSFRRNLLLVLKEALQNVAKHAGATRVEVRLRLSRRQLELLISDNGKGLSPTPETQWGQGLYNMQGRVDELEGSFGVETIAEGGTAVCIRVPLQTGSAGPMGDVPR